MLIRDRAYVLLGLTESRLPCLRDGEKNTCPKGCQKNHRCLRVVFCRASAHRKHPEPLALSSPQTRKAAAGGALSRQEHLWASDLFSDGWEVGDDSRPPAHPSYRLPVLLTESQGEPARLRAELGLGTTRVSVRAPSHRSPPSGPLE